MKRIDIHYGGERYSVGGRDVEGVLTEIEQGLGGGRHWLEVNDGDGAPQDRLSSDHPRRSGCYCSRS